MRRVTSFGETSRALLGPVSTLSPPLRPQQPTGGTPEKLLTVLDSAEVINTGSSSRWGSALQFIARDEQDSEPDDDDDVAKDIKAAVPFAQQWRWELHKFGGSSMSDIKNVAKVLTGHCNDEQLACVVSAMGGVTDSFFQVIDRCSRHVPGYLDDLEKVIERHTSYALTLMPDDKHSALRDKVITHIKADAQDMKEILRAIWIGRNFSVANVELITGYGELWSSLLLCAYLQSLYPLRQVDRIDARDVLFIKNCDAAVSAPSGDKKKQKQELLHVDWETSKQKLDAWRHEHAQVRWLIITGYICSTSEGVASTLKRNGSDFSAAIFGALLKAKAVTIWTDVSGVYSADPRAIKDARKLSTLTYEEATELAYYGGKVIHPDTMAPCMAHSIPLRIRSSFQPGDAGTTICRSSDLRRRRVKCFSALSDLALISIFGGPNLKLGSSGVVSLVFVALKENNIDIVLVTQAAFERSYRFCISADDSETAKQIIEDALLREITLGHVANVTLTSPCSVVAAIGEGVVAEGGTAARFFTALEVAGTTILVIAQGSSDRSISVVVPQKDQKNAMAALHSAFYRKTVSAKARIIPLVSGDERRPPTPSQLEAFDTAQAELVRLRALVREQMTQIGALRAAARGTRSRSRGRETMGGKRRSKRAMPSDSGLLILSSMNGMNGGGENGASPTKKSK